MLVVYRISGYPAIRIHALVLLRRRLHESMYYDCTGCRKTLDRPEPDEDGIDWAEIADFEAQHRAEADAA